MKTLLKTAFMMIFLSSCFTSVKQIGKLNMISNRNVESNANYVLVKTYAGASKKELKHTKAVTVEDAIDNTIRQVPGGEFLKNAKIYIVKHKYFAVEGDVWGLSGNISFKGFKVGDHVTWKNKRNLVEKIAGEKPYLTGVIKSLKDDQTCLIQIDGVDQKTTELLYDDISKTE